MVLVGTHDRHSALPRCVLLCLLVCFSFFLSFAFPPLFVCSFVLSGGESPLHWEYNHRALCSDCQWRSPCRRTLLEVRCPCLNWGLLLVECHDHKKMIKNGFHLRSRCVLSLLSSESHILGVEVAGLLLRTLLSS